MPVVLVAVVVRDGVRQRRRRERRRDGGSDERPEDEFPSPHELPSPGRGTVNLPLESLAGHVGHVGGEAVTGRLRDGEVVCRAYSPRGRAAPKNRPPSDFTKPIRSYMSWSV